MKKFLLIAIFSTMSLFSNATTIMLNPSQDTEIMEMMPDSAYPTRAYLVSNWAGNLRSMGLIKFDLSSISPDSIISSASLSLYHLLNSSQGTTYDLFAVTSAWSELTVTYNTPPSIEPVSVSSMTIADPDMAVWRDWDVTDIVSDWISGSVSNYGLWIEEVPVQGSGVAYFSSMNSDYVPALSIELAPSVAVPAPQSLVIMSLSFFTFIAFRRQRRF